MEVTMKPVGWPEGKRFAFTVFDDPDSQFLKDGKLIYDFMADLGFHTTKGVWPSGGIRPPNSPGDTCADPGYVEEALSLQRRGFEIGYHLNTLHASTREEVAAGLDRFRSYFGHDPMSMANHYNEEAIYWGVARLSGGLQRAIYNAATLGKKASRFRGHVENQPLFWGDLCRDRIRYCRNFVFLDINTLKMCPWMPYRDPLRPYVNSWYASTEGSNCRRFVNAITEANQDQLEAEGGCCIMYTHFGHQYVEKGKLNQRFQDLMKRLSKKNGWFAPVSTVLDYLREQRPETTLDHQIRNHLEWKWLGEKLFRGTS